MTDTLGRKALNRATLARQLLLERSKMTVPHAVEHLVGLQAQTPHTWYVGLWCRLDALRPEHVSELLEDRTLVRVALMRSTIHLVTARDCLAIRPLVQPVIERGMAGNFGKNLAGLDRDALAAAGRAVLERRPMIFSELGRELAQRYPGRDPASLAMAIRTSETLVQVTPRGLWGRSGRPAHTTARSWLGRGAARDATPLSVDDLVLRYLRAFGPASARDVQTWSGLVRLGEVLERLRPGLMVFRDDAGRELFDLPEAPRPDPDTPAAVRFLYDYDNLLLSHADRSRVVTDDYPRQGFSRNGVMPPAVLVDGVTAGLWTLDRTRAGATTLSVRPFRRWTKQQAAWVTAEGLALLRFLDPGGAHDVRVLPHLGT